MQTATCLGVIPARFQSNRLPGKPLFDIGGKSLLQHVWERTKQSRKLDRVIIATDHDKIVRTAQAFGAEVLMTREDHESGSDRVAEVVDLLKGKGEEFSFVANIQGDMPFINPEVINKTIAVLADSPEDVGMSTVATPIVSEGDFLRTSVVKVVLDDTNNAMYFSRSSIPYWREKDVSAITEESPYGLKHIGLYVYRPGALTQVTKFPQSMPETRERLEQLRALSCGIKIKVYVAPLRSLEPSIEVDTPSDLERARKAFSTSLTIP